MSEPERLGPGHPPLGMARKFYCTRKDCLDECEQYTSGKIDERTGEVIPGVLGRIVRTAFCRLHGELDYSANWQKRLELAGKDDYARNRLLDERARWTVKGHTYRGTAEREHVDRRSGDRT